MDTKSLHIRHVPADLHVVPAQRAGRRGMSLRHDVALADAPYVALAHRLGATLVIMDARLSRAPGIGVTVTVVTRSGTD